jgi:plastocyanin
VRAYVPANTRNSPAFHLARPTVAADHDERIVQMKNAIAAVTAATLAAGAVGVPLALAAPNTNVVRVSAVASGLKYNTKVLKARAGAVTIRFTNLSQLRHNVRLEIGEKEYGGTRTIGHGATQVTVRLARGVYHFYCSVPGHEDAGMSGTLTVS